MVPELYSDTDLQPAHHAAAFFAWHRIFIHTYEKALQTECGYDSHLTYWDWTLDWQNFTESPVWGSPDGFGGNGDASSTKEGVSHGNCVTDGPFANFQVPWVNRKVRPHCLSRGFLEGENLTHYGEWFQPSAVNSLMEKENYEEFFLGVEDGPHIAVPRSVRGDFAVLTAPSGESTQIKRI